MTLNIVSILDADNYISANFYKQTIEDLSLKISNYTVINIHLLLNKKNNFKEESIENRKYFFNCYTFTPKTYFELYKFLKKKKFLIHHCIPNNFDFFWINFILKISSCKLFVISDLGYNPENFNYFKKTIFYKIKIFFLLRLEYYLIRVLILLFILPKINFFFEASSFVINSIKNGISYKIEKIFPFFKISYYMQIIKINSKHYKIKNPEVSNVCNEYIIFIDGMLFDHKDVISREGIASNYLREKYFNKINYILMTLSNLYQKKIIICLHPKNNISEKRGDFANLQCVKFRTEEFINKSFIVLFHEGSSVVQAILLKKKILCLKGSILGDYINQRCSLYINNPGLESCEIEEFNLFEEKKIEFLNKLENRTKYFDKYITDNIVFDKTLLGIDQVIGYLKKQII